MKGEEIKFTVRKKTSKAKKIAVTAALAATTAFAAKKAKDKKAKDKTKEKSSTKEKAKKAAVAAALVATAAYAAKKAKEKVDKKNKEKEKFSKLALVASLNKPKTASKPIPSPSPSPSPSPLSVSKSSPSCFPGKSMVNLKNGRVVRMNDLTVGDMILSSVGEYSPVILFTHKLSEGIHSFVRIRTESGKAITCTPGHYVLVNGDMKAAANVKTGDTVRLANGNPDSVVQVEKDVPGTGLYNPVTASSEIIVDGIQASTYTLNYEPAASHALLLPCRKIFAWFGWDITFGSLNNGEPVEGLGLLTALVSARTGNLVIS